MSLQTHPGSNNQSLHNSIHIEFDPQPIINEKFFISSFNKISKMSNKIKSLIHGFIISNSTKLYQQNIAELIIFQIIAYCPISGCFNRILSSNVIYGSSMLFNRMKNYSNSKLITNQGFCVWNTAYSGIKIKPNENKTYLIKFIIHHKNKTHSDGNGVYLGITTFNKILCKDTNFVWSKEEYYAYCSNGKAYSYQGNDNNYMESYNMGDIIWMKIDFDSDFGRIYFRKNEYDQWWNMKQCKIKKDEDLVFDIVMSLYSNPSGGMSQVELEGIWMKENGKID
mmetsp:Transcript_68845/g.61828  ORF Transcript_68845/g.61828 Transcript_68845/m.61828 type:complete len:281 (-) Transcript_68845:199-1041(-)